MAVLDVSFLQAEDPLADAFRRHLAEAEQKCATHKKMAHRYTNLVFGLGIPAGTLAIAAGSTALADAASWVTAAIAFLSAAFTTAMTLVSPIERRAHHHRRAADYAAFQRDVRLAALALAGAPSEERLATLRRLDRDRYSLDMVSPFQVASAEAVGVGAQANGALPPNAPQ